MNENENKIYQNLWDVIKTVLKGKFIALSENVIKNKSLKSILFQEPRKKKGKQNRPKASRKKEIIKVKSEITKLKTENQWIKQTYKRA